MVESHKGNKIMVSIMLICGNDIFDDVRAGRILDGNVSHSMGGRFPYDLLIGNAGRIPAKAHNGHDEEAPRRFMLRKLIDGPLIRG